MLISHTTKSIEYQGKKYPVLCMGKYETLKFFIHVPVDAPSWKAPEYATISIDNEVFYNL